jgi:hypothetical protein
MTQHTITSNRGFFVFGDIALALAFGAICFVALNVTTGGLLVSIAGAVVIFAVVAVLHFLIWGRALSRSASTSAVSPADAATEVGTSSTPYSVALDEMERLELIRALEQSRAATLLPESDLRELLDRLRGFGA